MTTIPPAAGEIRQLLVHPAVWARLEAWLNAQGIELADISAALEDDLPTYVMTPRALLGEPAPQDGPVAPSAPRSTPGGVSDPGPCPEPSDERAACAHCGREIENRAEPSMGWPARDNWVHVPGAFTPCWPQRGADSPRAEPRIPETSGRVECGLSSGAGWWCVLAPGHSGRCIPRPAPADEPRATSN